MLAELKVGDVRVIFVSGSQQLIVGKRNSRRKCIRELDARAIRPAWFGCSHLVSSLFADRVVCMRRTPSHQVLHRRTYGDTRQVYGPGLVRKFPQSNPKIAGYRDTSSTYL